MRMYHNACGLVLQVDVEKEVHDFDGIARVQVTGGLVEKQQLGVVGECTSNSSAIMASSLSPPIGSMT